MVSTRRQALAKQLTNVSSPANLGNLPPELIHQIVWHLDSTQNTHCIDNIAEPSDATYDDSDCETVVSLDLTDVDVTKVQDCTLTCCRDGRTHDGRNGDLTWKDELVCISDSLNLSAASKRLREIIYIDGKKRCRTIRYCDWWKDETMAISEAVRGRYKKIKVIANKRHTVDPNGSQLAGLLKCFPMAETVDVIWELSVANTENTLKPTARFPRELPHLRSVLLHMEPDLHLDAEEFIPRELAMLFRHLPLSHLKKLDIDLIDMLGDDRMGALFDNLRQSFHYLDGSRLEVFRLQLDFDVMGLPVEDLWDAMEDVVDAVIDVTSLTNIFLTPTLIFDNTDEVLQTICTSTDDKVTLHESVMPSRERLEEWVGLIKTRCPNLERFRLEINWDTFVDDSRPPKDNSLLLFQYSELGKDDTTQWEDIEPSDSVHCNTDYPYSGMNGLDAGPDDSKAALSDDLFSYTIDSTAVKFVYEILKNAPPYVFEVEEIEMLEPEPET